MTMTTNERWQLGQLDKMKILSLIFIVMYPFYKKIKEVTFSMIHSNPFNFDIDTPALLKNLSVYLLSYSVK